MRPRKVILCVSANEHDLSVTRFTLEVSGYRVVAAATPEEAIAAAHSASSPIDLALIDFAVDEMDGSELAVKLRLASPRTPILLLVPGEPKTLDEVDALVLNKKTVTGQELLERIKMMSTRKRGPRKGSVRTKLPELLPAGAA